jgi:HlyD family secretion protein
MQRKTLQARITARRSRESVFQAQIAQLNEQVNGLKTQIQASDTQKNLLESDLKAIGSMADQGYAPMAQLRSLQRNQAAMQGQVDQYKATTELARQRAEEIRMQILRDVSQEREDVSKQLQDINFQINDLTPKLTAAREQLARTQIRAPRAGRVIGLGFQSEGGVVGPGQTIMDIVPDEQNLVIEVQISPTDIHDLHPGLTTEVRLGGGRERLLPLIEGVLTQIGADVLRNESTGAAFYPAQVVIPEAQLEKLRAKMSSPLDLRAGMPAQVVIPTAKRSALQFLVEPLTDSLWRSFRER